MVIVDAGIGPQFTGVRFVSNAAQIRSDRWWVFITGGGTSGTEDEYSVKHLNTTTLNRCQFIGNDTTANGGAVDSALGPDAFSSTWFEGNSARVGGALRVAGIASLVNCTSVENTSDEDGRPTVSNMGHIAVFDEISFVGDVFECESRTFLNV